MDLKSIFVLATVTESIVEYFLSPLFDRYDLSDFLRYASMLVGVAFCVLYKVDILNQIAGLTAVSPVVGWIVSGLLLGRGSNFINDLFGLIRKDSGRIRVLPYP